MGIGAFTASKRYENESACKIAFACGPFSAANPLMDRTYATT